MKFKFESDRLCLENESGRIIAQVDFSADEKGNCEITKTFVDDSLRGKGIAKDMMKLVAEEMKKRGTKVVPICSYAKRFFEENADKYAGIIIDEQE